VYTSLYELFVERFIQVIKSIGMGHGIVILDGAFFFLVVLGFDLKAGWSF
jgi:hypothetical protein